MCEKFGKRSNQKDNRIRLLSPIGLLEKDDERADLRQSIHSEASRTTIFNHRAQNAADPSQTYYKGR